MDTTTDRRSVLAALIALPLGAALPALPAAADAAPLPDVEFCGLGVHRPALGARADVAAIGIRVVDGEPWVTRRDGRPVARLSEAAFRELAAAVLALFADGVA